MVHVPQMNLRADLEMVTIYNTCGFFLLKPLVSLTAILFTLISAWSTWNHGNRRGGPPNKKSTTPRNGALVGS